MTSSIFIYIFNNHYSGRTIHLWMKHKRELMTMSVVCVASCSRYSLFLQGAALLDKLGDLHKLHLLRECCGAGGGAILMIYHGKTGRLI